MNPPKWDELESIHFRIAAQSGLGCSSLICLRGTKNRISLIVVMRRAGGESVLPEKGCGQPG
jgi:hypothetical protein